MCSYCGPGKIIQGDLNYAVGINGNSCFCLYSLFYSAYIEKTI